MRDEEVIQRLHAGYDAFNRGDFDSAAALFHPDAEYIPVGGQTPIRGADQIRAWMEPSGIEMEVDAWTVMTRDSDGLVTRVETFFLHDEAEARAAAGLGSGGSG